MMTRKEFLAKVAQVHREWEPTAVAGAIPDPAYKDNDPSQYPENVVAVSATPEDDARYWARIDALVKEYRGLP